MGMTEDKIARIDVETFHCYVFREIESMMTDRVAKLTRVPYFQWVPVVFDFPTKVSLVEFQHVGHCRDNIVQLA